MSDEAPHSLLPHEISAKAKEMAAAAHQLQEACEHADLEMLSEREIMAAIALLAKLQINTLSLIAHLAARPSSFPFI